jgi:hypothetical protein
MADSPSTGISILQILSVPALLAAITGVGSFLKSLWDKWSERRSLIGLQKLTDYLDLDNKRDSPLLTRQTRELIDYEINLKFREFAGTPAYDAVEKVERWRRRPYVIRAMWIPPEIRKQFGPTLILSKGSKAKPSKNIRNSVLAIRVTLAASVTSLFTAFASRYIYGMIEIPGIVFKLQKSAVRQNQSALYYALLLAVVVATFVVLSGWAALLANADWNARE